MKRPFAALAILLLSGCATPPPTVAPPPPTPPDPHRIVIQTGDVLGEVSPSRSQGSPPGLADVLSTLPRPVVGDPEAENQEVVDRMRATAQAYGVQAGLAWGTVRIREMLEANADSLTRLFDFRPVVLTAPNGVRVMAPVIMEQGQSYELRDEGLAIRVADRSYDIVRNARLMPSTPLWRGYLTGRRYASPEPPDNTLMPQTEAGRRLYQAAVAEGWRQGIDQAYRIFETDLRRLARDFRGMIAYRRLHQAGLVTAPIIVEAELGTTGGGDRMMVGVRDVRITKPASLNPESRNWRPVVVTEGEK